MFHCLFSAPAATTLRSASSESAPRNASPRKTRRTRPLRTYSDTIVGSAARAHWAQYGHCRSAYSTSVTAARGLPSAAPCCGMPANSEGCGGAAALVASLAPTWLATIRAAASAAALPRTKTKRLRVLMRHRPLDVSDVQEADLAEIDGGERMAHEGVEPRLVDLDVEDAPAAGRDERRLDVALVVRHVRVHPGAVEDRADDVKVGIEARARVDDPEANGLTGIGRQRMRHVLAGIAVPRHPVRLLPLGLGHVEGCRLREAGRAQVPLARDQDVVLVGVRKRRPRLDDDRPVHAVRDMRQDRLRAAVEHERAGIVRDERIVDRAPRLHVFEGDVRRDPRCVEVDRVWDHALVGKRQLDLLTLTNVDERRWSSTAERPGAVLHTGSDLDRLVDENEVHPRDRSGRRGRQRRAHRN